MAAQRAKSPELRKMWEKAAKVLAAAAILITAGCGLLIGDPGAFDITQCFALLVGYVPVPTIHYAQSLSLIGGLILATATAWTALTCSARS